MTDKSISPRRTRGPLPSTHFGSRLRLARRVAKLTLSDVAQATGVSFQAVQRWEAGDQYPELPRVWPLAQALGVPVAYLLDPAPMEPRR